jgi:hypothetical protein
VHPKGGKTVTVPLAPRTARAGDLAVGEQLDGPIFVGSNGPRMTRDAAAPVVRRIAKAAGGRQADRAAQPAPQLHHRRARCRCPSA